MSWPSPQDYNEAVQTPAVSFIDAELRPAIAECNQLGLPRCVTGAFASVYHLHDNGKDWAVRCFLHPLVDRTDRYERISDFITHDDLSYTVSFQFLEEGVLIHGNTYPILKMDWVGGETLGSFVRRNLANREVLLQLAADFKQMVERLQQTGVAHGDLQHDNIMMSGKELILVDYDGLFVPSLTGREASELGHRNYQHPFRTKAHFGSYLDNFSSWLIFLSLQCLAVDPELWQSLQGGDDCLLLRQRDFADPLSSSAFLALESHKSEEIRRASRFIRSLLFLPVDQLPPVKEVAPDSAVPDLPGLDYDRVWYEDYTGTTSGAPLAHIGSQAEPEQVSAEADHSGEDKKSAHPAVATVASFPAIKKDLAFKEQLSERSLDEIEIEICFQLPADEPVLWSHGLSPNLTIWDNIEGNKGTILINQFVLAMFLSLCAVPFGGGLALVFFCLALIYFHLQTQRLRRHLWYALTDRRLIIVYRDESLRQKGPMRVGNVPLSNILSVSLLELNDSIKLFMKTPIAIGKSVYQSEILLFGFGGDEIKRLSAAWPTSKFILKNEILIVCKD